MCSRFELDGEPRRVAVRFGLTVPPPWPNRAEFRPTDAVLAVGPAGTARLLRWGLVVGWDKRPLINARAETLATRASFRPLLEHRVLVPATAWWEWQPDAAGKGRTRMRLGLADGAVFALAGLSDGERLVIVTCAPAPAVAHVHDRMPVVLAPAAEAAWVDPARTFANVAALLAPFAGPLAAAPEPPPPAPQGDLFG